MCSSSARAKSRALRSAQPNYALKHTLNEHLAAVEEDEVKPESKQQKTKTNADEVPETFAELVEECKETDGRGIRKKSQTTFEHYGEARLLPIFYQIANPSNNYIVRRYNSGIRTSRSVKPNSAQKPLP